MALNCFPSSLVHDLLTIFIPFYNNYIHSFIHCVASTLFWCIGIHFHTPGTEIDVLRVNNIGLLCQHLRRGSNYRPFGSGCISSLAWTGWIDDDGHRWTVS